MTNYSVRYSRNPDFIFRKVVNEMILVPIHQDVNEMDSIYSLNDVGAFIWEILSEPKSMMELKIALQEEYVASPERITKDLNNFFLTFMAFDAVIEK